jgi:carbamoylphosphate synthase large subunit
MAVSGDVIEVDFTQGEVGPVATSPIATTAGTGSRNADVITLSGAVSGCIGQTEGTIYAEVDIQFNNRNADIIGLDSGSSANGFYLTIRSSSVIELRVRQNSTNALIFQRTGAYPVGINKIAVSYKNGDFAISLNGTTTQVDTSTITMPSVAITRASVVPSVNFTLDQSVRVRAAALYTTRLTNAELQSLTTL